MLSRRRFSACAICAAVGGFVATGAAAKGQPQGQPSGLVSLESLDRLFWPVRWRTRDRRALG